MMLSFIINSLPPLLLLLAIWTSLILIYFFIKNQIKKDSIDKNFNELSEEEIEKFAIYVSHLPRPKDLLKKLELDEEENK